VIRLMRRVAVALLAACIVVGPPALALAWAVHSPRRHLGVDDARGWVADPPDDSGIWVLVAVAAIGLWLLCATLVLRAATSAARRGWRRVRHLSLPTPAQATASSLAGTALLGVPAITSTPADTAPASTGVGHDRHDPDRSVGDHGAHLHDGVDPTAVKPGIELPGGGWIPYPTALAVAAVSTLIWFHRRQHYPPDPRRFGRHHGDGDLRPLPITAQAITALTADATLPAGPGLAVLPDLPAGRLTLYGPGAADAARGLLTTMVLHTALADTSMCRVTVGRATLRMLLHTDLAEPFPDGLDIDSPVTTSPESADPVGGTDLADGAGLVLLATRRSPANRAGEPAGGESPFAAPGDRTTLVTVADHPAGPVCWHVGADGTVHNPLRDAPRRLCVLSPSAAGDLLRLVQHHARPAVALPSEPAPPVAPPVPPSEPAGRLTLLGGCALQIDGTAVHLRRSAGLQILAYLAVHTDGATTTDLLRAVWPGNPANTITKRLHTTLTDLRQQLQPTIVEPVIRRHDRYLLNTEMITTDLHQLRQSITAAQAALTAHQRRSALHAVINAYLGELAAGFAWPWLHAAREALRREVIDAHLLLAEAADPAEAAELIQAAATIDPYNGDLNLRARALLRTAGDQAGADSLAQAYTQRLTAARRRTGPPGTSASTQDADLRL
jgi:DNA-binding SARP family transcriptional activator